MQELTFVIQGSSPEPYTVQFKKSGDKLSAYCSCPAGENGQICKHRMRILEGNTEGLVSSNAEEVKVAESWLKGSNIETALADIRSAEVRFEAAKKELALLKKNLAKALSS